MNFHFRLGSGLVMSMWRCGFTSAISQSSGYSLTAVCCLFRLISTWRGELWCGKRSKQQIITNFLTYSSGSYLLLSAYQQHKLRYWIYFGSINLLQQAAIALFGVRVNVLKFSPSTAFRKAHKKFKLPIFQVPNLLNANLKKLLFLLTLHFVRLMKSSTFKLGLERWYQATVWLPARGFSVLSRTRAAKWKTRGQGQRRNVHFQDSTVSAIWEQSKKRWFILFEKDKKP